MKTMLAPAVAATDWLDPLLDSFTACRVAVVGDCCLDVYWSLDSRPGECSLETGLLARQVNEQRATLGGAANVAANLRALGAEVELIGLLGRDCFGNELRRLAAEAGVDGRGLLDATAGWQTPVFVKPLQGGDEQPRFDVGAGNRLAASDIARLGEALAAAADRCDALIINQQVGRCLADARLHAVCNRIIADHPELPVLVDVRNGAAAFRGAMLKLNLLEAQRLLGDAAQAGAEIVAQALHERVGTTVFVTRGEHGLVMADDHDLAVVPGIRCDGPVDPVGAGDATVAALACGLAAGAAHRQAAELAVYAAAVTVRKIQCCGTATPAEIAELAANCDRLHEPELAADLRRARYHAGSGIELVRDIAPAALGHVIFDHDGTISTLRQGWESVMAPMMERAVLGAHYDTVDSARYAEVQAAVHALIDRSTGIQTLMQMELLRGLIRDFGFVPEPEICDCHAYKAVFNQDLMAMVRAREAKLAAGILEPADFIIRGAEDFLRRLRAAGLRCYLASGTDQDDVRAEAAALGYDDCFDGGIYGAVGSLTAEAKRDVMDRIMRDNGIDGSRLLVLGDGPVEIREGRRRGATCIGIASDEVRRYGLEASKRKRLILAGADIIVPDFTEQDRLLAYLNIQ